MAILTHGSQLTLAPTIAPLVRQSQSNVRDAIAQLSKHHFRSVQLDATLAGMRPRELDQRARRDLSALLTRSSIQLAGLDAFIPIEHFQQPAYQDRATVSMIAAIELAHELGRVPVSLCMPMVAELDDLRKALIEAADARCVPLAFHHEHEPKVLLSWLNRIDLPSVGAALDPAASLQADIDPVAQIHQLSSRLLVARLSDAKKQTRDSVQTGLRTPIGQGDLDLLSYRIAVDLASHRIGPVVLDLRGMENPLQSALHAAEQWQQAAPHA